MNKIRNYLSLIKFSHTIFAMPFALIGFFLAIKGNNHLLAHNQNLYHELEGQYGFEYKYGILIRFGLIVFCMVFARSAAMAFNRYLDAQYDAINPRTVIREIPSGIISSRNALYFVIVNCLLFTGCCFLINRICFYLSPVALFIILFYSYTKRFTALCHLVLGLGLSLAPIGAYIAVTGEFSFLPILFSITVFCWVSGFDIIYALQDEEFDKEYSLHSIPAAFGKVMGLRLSELLHLLAAASVVYAGYNGHFGMWYWAGAIAFLLLLVYQHLLVKPHDLSKVNRAFFTTNGVASVIFASFVIGDLFFNY